MQQCRDDALRCRLAEVMYGCVAGGLEGGFKASSAAAGGLMMVCSDGGLVGNFCYIIAI